MQNARDAGFAEIWKAAQNRRTEDLAGRRASPAAGIRWLPNMSRLALMRGLSVAVVVFGLLTSVSVAVQAKKHPPVVLRPTAPMPAVNVP
jgi:hypothetical protein